jgi:phage-related minor tail protein
MFKLYNIRNDKVTAAGDKLRELGRAETEAKAKAVRSLSEISKGMFGEEMKVKTKEIDRAFDVWKTKYEQGQANIRAQAGRSPDQLALLTKYPAGTKEGDELRKNITFMKGAGRDDPILKDPRYKNLTEQLSMEEMMLSRQTDPAKKLATQERIADIQRKINVLTGGGSGTVTGSSTLPPGFVPDK